MPPTPSLPSLYTLPSLPSLPSREPSGESLDDPPHASHRETLSPSAREALDALEDPIDGQADLRDFPPDALSEWSPSMLRDCAAARYVAVPARCPVTAIHALLVGLPSLEALFTWDPADSQPICLTLGRQLKLIVADLGTLSRVMGPGEVQRFSCNDAWLPLEALRRQALDAPQQAPQLWQPMPCPAPASQALDRRWSTMLILNADRATTTRNDLVGYRLATWQQTGSVSSRPTSPASSASPASSVEAPVLRPGRARRLRSACESLLERLPVPVLRRSKSV